MALGRDGGRHPLEKALVECKRLYGDSWLDLTQEDEARGRDFVDAFLDSEPNRLGEKFRISCTSTRRGMRCSRSSCCGRCRNGAT